MLFLVTLGTRPCFEGPFHIDNVITILIVIKKMYVILIYFSDICLPL